MAAHGLCTRRCAICGREPTERGRDRAAPEPGQVSACGEPADHPQRAGVGAGADPCGIAASAHCPDADVAQTMITKPPEGACDDGRPERARAALRAGVWGGW